MTLADGYGRGYVLHVRETAVHLAESAAGLEGGNHVCAAYRSARELDVIVESYVTSAVSAGQKPMFLTRQDAPAAYGGRHVTDPDGLMADFEREAARAVAEGHSGWAVVVDGTGLVSTPESRASFAQWEHLADRMFRSNGKMTALCVYDARELGAEAVAELGVLHQQTLPDDTPFHLVAGGEGLQLDGELDLATMKLLGSALAAVTPATDRDVVVDVSQLEFIDPRSLGILDHHAEAQGKRFVLLSAKPIIQRMIESCGVGHVTAVTT
jgi:anti-anti-sigma factor